MADKRPSSRRAPNAGNAGNGSNWIRKEKRLRIYARDNYHCVWCQRRVRSMHAARVDGAPIACLDHVVPRASGGSNEASNLLTSCLACNEDRGTRSALEYAWERACAATEGVIEGRSQERARILDRVLAAMGAPLPAAKAAA